MSDMGIVSILTDNAQDSAARMWLLGLASQAHAALEKPETDPDAPLVFVLTRDQFPLIVGAFAEFTELLRENDRLKAQIERQKQRRRDALAGVDQGKRKAAAAKAHARRRLPLSQANSATLAKRAERAEKAGNPELAASLREKARIKRETEKKE